MANLFRIEDLADRALRLSADALAAGLYDGAYYGLQSALDCARLLSGDEALTRVDRLACKMQGELQALRASNHAFLPIDTERMCGDLDDLQCQVNTLLNMRQALRWQSGATPAA